MGVFDKIKNIFFEEEYVEVEEEVKKPKKEIKKEKITVAKKIELPEIKKEKIKEEPKEEIEEELEEDVEEEQEEVVEPKQENKFKFPMTFEEDDFVAEPVVEEEPPRPIYREETTRSLYKEENVRPLYREEPKKEEYSKYTFENERVPLYEGREEKKDKPIFRPTPIISPIYGILDKNYKKEEIVTKKPIVLSTSSSRRMDLDQVREKAYGDLASDITASMEEEKVEVKEEETTNENTFYDLNIDSPAVERVTVGDAEEYFNDLGLEYNVDYKDNSIERATGRRSTRSAKHELEDDDTSLENNLFDLIESMYEDKEEE